MKKILFIALFGSILACNEGSMKSEAAFVDQELAAVYDGDIAGNSATPYEDSKAVVDDAKIIKSAEIEFETQDMQQSYDKIRKAIAAQGGSLQKDNTGKDYSRQFRVLIIRVPSANFLALVDDVCAGVENFDTRQISRVDVGEEFVDLQARLKAKRSLEARYLSLLDKAKNVEEILKIERELAVIREEIEAKQGRLKYLQNRVSQSTISLRFYQKIEGPLYTEASFGSKIADAFSGGWEAVLAFIVALLYLWPFLLIATIVFFVIRRYLKRKREVEVS